MADSDDPKTEDSAEKAYAAAAEAVGDKGDSEVEAAKPAAEPADEPVQFPAKPKRARKAEAKTDEPVAVAPPAAEPAPRLRRARAAASNPVKVAKPAKPVINPIAKRTPIKPVAATKSPLAPSTPLRKASVQKTKTAPKAAPKSVEASTAAASATTSIAQRKGTPMDTTSTINEATSTVENAASTIQDKAKEAFTKGSAFAGEFGEFAKGNVEAFVESGKILASGLQDIGNTLISEGKSAFENVSADVKALTSVKSPTEFFQLQTDILRRNFDTAVSNTTKNGEAVLKLTSDVIKPISGRVTLAVQKLKTAA